MINSELQAVDITFIPELFESSFTILVAVKLFGEGGGFILVGIGPQVKPDETELMR